MLLALFALRNLKQICSGLLRYDLVYINSIRLLPILLPLLWLFRKEFVIHVHLLHDVAVLRLLKIASRFYRCKAVVCCSELVYSSVENFVAPDRLVTIRNSLQSRLSELPFENRFKESIRVGFIGDISFQKGADIIINLSAKFPSIDFFLIGRNKLGIDLDQENIYFENSCGDIKKFIDVNGINVILVPSRVPESFGLVAIESCAMSCITAVSSVGYLHYIGKLCELSLCDSEIMYSDLLTKLSSLSADDLGNIAKKSWRHVNNEYSYTQFEIQVAKILMPRLVSGFE